MSQPTPESRPKKLHHSKKKPSDQSLLRYSGLAFQLAVTIFLGTFAGRKLDNFLELETHYLTILGAFIGAVAAFYYLTKDVTSSV
ncbi:MAG: AtpZ/AtpI family protein [Bacteroidota bacterium]